MKNPTYTYWQDGDFWVGYLDEYPDFPTQGQTERELRENLLDIYQDIANGLVPNARRHAELKLV
ncbi:MAG: hypothetical protein LBK76_08495 [Verrucomicrobiales bacterium]|jgi:predicted RNase H-like HicB family nuclease|nr:hypothetical protein [Verrucomicrobiales bacterium]